MVRSVSEDKLYDTIEFNEFLLMMGKHQDSEINMDALMEAFKLDYYLTLYQYHFDKVQLQLYLNVNV